jgi:hypothetical protein
LAVKCKLLETNCCLILRTPAELYLAVPRKDMFLLPQYMTSLPIKFIAELTSCLTGAKENKHIDSQQVTSGQPIKGIRRGRRE